MTRTGRIVRVAGAGRVVVALDPAAGCARCARGRGCEAALFAPRTPPVVLECRLDGADPAAAPVGTRVEIEPGTGSGWLAAVLAAYAPPTLGLVAGAFVPEPWTAVAALGGLGAGLLAGRALAASPALRARCAGEGGERGPRPPRARIPSAGATGLAPHPGERNA